MTNEWQTDLEDWEYVKALGDGWKVECNQLLASRGKEDQGGRG